MKFIVSIYNIPFSELLSGTVPIALYVLFHFILRTVLPESNTILSLSFLFFLKGGGWVVKLSEVRKLAQTHTDNKGQNLLKWIVHVINSVFLEYLFLLNILFIYF